MDYHFAKSSHVRRRHNVKPTLVTQLQRFSNDGRLYETIDFLSVNLLTALFSEEVRHFSKDLGRPPTFLMTRNILVERGPRASGRDIPNTYVGAMSCDKHFEEVVALGKATFQTQAAKFTMFETTEGNYDIFENAKKVAQWKLDKTNVSKQCGAGHNF